MCFRNAVSGNPFCMFKDNAKYDRWETFETNYLTEPPTPNKCKVRVSGEMMQEILDGRGMVAMAAKSYDYDGDRKEAVVTVFWLTHGDGKYIPDGFKVMPNG